MNNLSTIIKCEKTIKLIQAIHYDQVEEPTNKFD